MRKRGRRSKVLKEYTDGSWDTHAHNFSKGRVYVKSANLIQVYEHFNKKDETDKIVWYDMKGQQIL